MRGAAPRGSAAAGGAGAAAGGAAAASHKLPLPPHAGGRRTHKAQGLGEGRGGRRRAAPPLPPHRDGGDTGGSRRHRPPLHPSLPPTHPLSGAAPRKRPAPLPSTPFVPGPSRHGDPFPLLSPHPPLLPLDGEGAARGGCPGAVPCRAARPHCSGRGRPPAGGAGRCGEGGGGAPSLPPGLGGTALSFWGAVAEELEAAELPPGLPRRARWEGGERAGAGPAAKPPLRIGEMAMGGLGGLWGA